MNVLQAIAAFFAAHMTKLLGTAQTIVAATLGAAAAKQIPDLVAIDSTGFQILTLLNILLGGATIARGFNNGAQIKVATAIDNALHTPPPKQGGFARVGMLLAVAIAALVLMAGCGTNPVTGERQLTATEKVAMQEIATIALRRSIGDSPRAQEKVANIRHVATRLQAATAVTSISELRLVVDAELDQLKLTAIDRADANSLLNIFQALLIERIGKDEIDAQALVTVNEFVSMIVAALPPS